MKDNLVNLIVSLLIDGEIEFLVDLSPLIIRYHLQKNMLLNFWSSLSIYCE